MSHQLAALSPDEPRSEVRRCVAALARLDHAEWAGPGLQFLAERGSDDLAADLFLRDLERLAMSLSLRRVDAAHRSRRYGRLMFEIEDGVDLAAPTSALQLTAMEKIGTVAALHGDVYNARFARSLLLRLDSLLVDSDSPVDYNVPTLSIEHCLPQSPTPGCEWLRWYPDPVVRARVVNCLGNLCLLSRRKNARASSLPWRRKRDTYLTRGVVPFALTTLLLREDEFTLPALERRQRQLVDLLSKEWRLS